MAIEPTSNKASMGEQNNPPARNKKPKRPLLLVLVAMILILAGVILFTSKKGTILRRVPSPTHPVTKQPVSPSPTPRKLAAGKQTFTIMSGPDTVGPKMREVTIDPYDAEKGARQSIAVLLDDPEGITEAYVTILTDTKDTVVSLAHVVGSQQEGLWTGTWTVNDKHDKRYSMIFTAKAANTSANAELTIR